MLDSYSYSVAGFSSSSLDTCAVCAVGAFVSRESTISTVHVGIDSAIHFLQSTKTIPRGYFFSPLSHRAVFRSTCTARWLYFCVSLSALLEAALLRTSGADNFPIGWLGGDSFLTLPQPVSRFTSTTLARVHAHLDETRSGCLIPV